MQQPIHSRRHNLIY